jgi:ABC-type branched-subunit amino acid transport system permease subunit
MPFAGGSYWTGQFTLYLIYGLFAMSLALVWGRGGILCFGQAMFFGIGGYVMAAFTKGMVHPALTSTYLGLLLACLAAGGFAALLGYFLFWGRGLQGAYLAIVTLAIALVLERLMSNWYAMGGYNGLLDVPPLDLGLFGVQYELWDRIPLFYAILVITGLVYIGVERLLRAPFGLVLTAVKTNPDRAGFLGFDIFALKLKTFVIGAMIAGLAGALFVAVDGYASPTLIGFTLSTEVLIWVALGGKEMILAAFLGALLTRWAEAWLSDLLGNYWIFVLGLIFMVSVVLLPRGLIATPLQALARRFDRG